METSKSTRADAAAHKNGLAAARLAFLQNGKPSLSVRKREVLGRSDLDERLEAAIEAYAQRR